MNERQENLKKTISKMVNVTKPKGVSLIDFELIPIQENKYGSLITYVVPDDSMYLKMKTNPRIFESVRQEWNQSIKKSINNYFDVEVIINESEISSESWYNQNLNNN
jgi:hypothetical protein